MWPHGADSYRREGGLVALAMIADFPNEDMPHVLSQGVDPLI